MQVILLSGGSGKRLWPLSNEIRSKQFVKIFQGIDGYESMLQRTLRQIFTIPAQVTVTVSTSAAQEKVLKKYLPANADTSAEPCRRNTFPAIALTAAYLRDVKKIDDDMPIIICPVDPYVDDNFFAQFTILEELVKNSAANLILLGINPTYPSEKYGYIIPASKDEVSDVIEFKEKPDLATAEKYISEGGLWNGGVFACKISYVLEKARDILKFNSYDELLSNYAELPNISFDYAVVEHEKNIKVVRYSGEWKDVGTWNTLTEVMSEQNIGKVYFDNTCQNTHVVNETDTPIIAMGLKNIVVAASPDGILVADKNQSSYMKPLAEKIHEQVRFAEKSWGTYQVIDAGENNLTIKVILNAGHQMRYHSHERRDEVWTVVEGTGRVNLNDEFKTVEVGNVVKIPAGVKHTIYAVTDLKVIEVQIGDVSVEDKILHEEKKIIISKLRAGLGNQLFQYAIARCLAHRRNAELKLDTTYWDIRPDKHHNFYKLNNFNIQENFATPEEIQSSTLINEPPNSSGIFVPEILNSPPNVALEGFWQNEKYFSEIRDILLEEFTLKNPLGKNSAAWREKILSAECAVSVHVRHGDYLTYGLRNGYGLLSAEHYFKCVEELRKDFPNITVFVFSDDLDWCKVNLKFNVPTEFVEGCEHDFEELHLVSLCKHNIVSNGTFGWWGAWLNKNPDKKVLAPDPWFSTNPHLAIVPESWMKIPEPYPSWTPPMLSIIVYSEIPPSDSSINLKSILSQTSKDYEIIFINPSKNNEEKVYRHKVNGIRFSVLTVNNFKNKSEAWNKGLSIARGDYVLFLTAKDFIVDHTAHFLQSVCDRHIFTHADNSRTHLTYANRLNYLPNIICSTKNFKEDANGNIFINELPHKKFSITTDVAFQNLNEIAEWNFTDEQKLMVLATNSINHFVGRKFFKRKFLNENTIWFNETARVGMNVELLFVIEAFLKTEIITFIPQPFLGLIE